MGEDGLLLEGDSTAAELDQAVDLLEDALERVDLEREPDRAEAVLEALAAADRARQE